MYLFSMLFCLSLLDLVNTTLTLSSLKSDDFQATKGCEITVQQNNDCAYFINWPDCSRIIDGNHPTFVMLLNCEELDVVMPAGGPIKPARIPYKLEGFGDRYLEPGPGSFDLSPCERSIPDLPGN